MAKRYTCNVYYDEGMVEHTSGEYVGYEDYRKLESIIYSLLAEAGEGNVSEGLLKELQELYIL